jgi:putative tricarboxylic transport membrane protein
MNRNREITGMSTIIRRTALASLAGTALTLLAGPAALADWEPTQPVTVVVHWSAGGGTDVVFRGLTDIINEQNLSPQPWVVTNRTGGAGMNGFTYLVDQAGDPHTIGAITPSILVTLLMQPIDVDWRQTTPLGNLILDPQFLVVHDGTPFRTIEDFVEVARDNPGTVTVAGAQIGQEDHLTNLMMEQAIGIETRFVAVEGGIQVKQNLLGGHVDGGWLNPSEYVGSLVEDGGNLVLLGIALDQRIDAYPDVPTFIESGYDVNFDMFFRGVVAPADIPAEAVAFYERVLEEATSTPEWKAFTDRIMVEPVFIPPAEYTDALERWESQLSELVPLVQAAQ